MFVSSKIQNIHLLKLNDQLDSKKPDNFNVEIWGKFIISQVIYMIIFLLSRNLRR